MINTNLTIAQLINSGAHDAELDEISQALESRRRNTISTVNVGQAVWLNNIAGTRYLRGRQCIVRQVNRVRIVVELVNKHPDERFQGQFTCPPSIITTTKPPYAVD